MICTHQILPERYNLKKILDGRVMWHVLRAGEVHTGVLVWRLRERDHLEDLDVDAANRRINGRQPQ
jgi:hypothetical protein